MPTENNVGGQAQDPSPSALPAASTVSRPQPTASFRLPPFSAEEPELWLQQVECAFAVAGVADQSQRYHLLVSQLPMVIATQVRDVITTSPGSFDTLVGALRQRLAHSTAGKLEALLRHQQLGDQRPSQLLRRMRSELTAAGDAPTDTGLLRTLFLQRLPPTVRAALALLSEDKSLDDMAQAADRFLEASGLSPWLMAAVTGHPQPGQGQLLQTAQPSHPPQHGQPLQPPQLVAQPRQSAPQSIPGMDVLQGMMAALTSTVGRLETALASSQERGGSRHSSPRRSRECSCNCQAQQGRSRDGRRQRSQSRGRPQQQEHAGLCFYHARFGADAHRCRSPCTWRGNEQA